MNRPDKTIILFSPAFPANETDTVWLPWLQTFVRALNTDFAQLRVIVIAFQYPHSTQTYEWHGNTIIPFNGFYKKKKSRLLMWFKILAAVIKIKKENNVLGIYSMWCSECTLVAKYVAKLLNLKYYCWILGQDARKDNIYVKLIRPKAESLVAMSDYLVAEFYKSHGIKPQHIITNGVDTSLFKKDAIVKDIDIIGVGSLNALKQYHLLVQSVAVLQKELPNIRAVMCGDGEERQTLEALVQQLAVGENLTLAGMLPHVAGLHMMQRAKILLHPSSYEGFSTVCLEALYAGAHVISFIQPMQHQVKHWHIVQTVEEMQAKALELLTDTNTKYEAVLPYSISDSAKQIMELFYKKTES